MADILPFEKWHGTGNDFVIVSHKLAGEYSKGDLSSLAEKMCDRHFGAGSDGLITVGKSDVAEFRMRMWNPDGSEAEMCGNGLRCVGVHLFNHGLAPIDEETPIETGKGTVILSFPEIPEWANQDERWVRLGMGEAVLEREKIPITGSGESPVVEEELKIDGIDVPLKYTAVNVGNPHAVFFVDDIESVPLASWGPEIENYTEVFPERVNAEFVQVVSREHVRMVVWERGAGITLSCGSGTVAVQVACHLTGKAGDRLRVDVPGGSVITEHDAEGRNYLSGPAVRVYTGEWG